MIAMPAKGLYYSRCFMPIFSVFCVGRPGSRRRHRSLRSHGPENCISSFPSSSTLTYKTYLPERSSNPITYSLDRDFGCYRPVSVVSILFSLQSFQSMSNLCLPLRLFLSCLCLPVSSLFITFSFSFSRLLLLLCLSLPLACRMLSSLILPLRPFPFAPPSSKPNKHRRGAFGAPWITLRMPDSNTNSNGDADDDEKKAPWETFFGCDRFDVLAEAMGKPWLGPRPDVSKL